MPLGDGFTVGSLGDFPLPLGTKAYAQHTNQTSETAMIDRTECAAVPPERNRSINMPDALHGSQPVQPDNKSGL